MKKTYQEPLCEQEALDVDLPVFTEGLNTVATGGGDKGNTGRPRAGIKERDDEQEGDAWTEGLW